MAPRERLEIGQSRHAPVLAQDLAQRPHRTQSGECAEIGHRFGVTGSSQHAARDGAQGEDVTGTREVRGARTGIGQHAQRARTIERGGSGAGAPPRVHRFGEWRSEAGRVLADHEPQLELVGDLRRHRRAQDAAPVLEGEVDLLDRGLLGGEHDVALVFTIRVVDHDDHLAGADAAHGFGHVDEDAGGAVRPSRLHGVLPARPASSTSRAR